jgi:hypothetical protein
MTDATDTGTAGADGADRPRDRGRAEQEQAFTQADVDRIVRERLAQQAKNKFGDYDDLKSKAGVPRRRSRSASHRWKANSPRPGPTRSARTSPRSSASARRRAPRGNLPTLTCSSPVPTNPLSPLRRSASRVGRRTGRSKATSRPERAATTTSGQDNGLRDFTKRLFGEAD